MIEQKSRSRSDFLAATVGVHYCTILKIGKIDKILKSLLENGAVQWYHFDDTVGCCYLRREIDWKDPPESPKGVWTMLVLSRRVGEGVCIGDNIKVTIVRIDGNQIRLTIDAPRSIPILREELLMAPAKPQEKPVTSSK